MIAILRIFPSPAALVRAAPTAIRSLLMVRWSAVEIVLALAPRIVVVAVVVVSGCRRRTRCCS
jgi:hypothetical protein